MALNKENVRISVTGAVYLLPDGHAPITSANQQLPAGTVELGYISEDGVTITRDRSTENITAWQHSAVVRTLTTEASVTYAGTCIEDSKEVREFWYGSPEVNGHIAWNPANAFRGAVVIDALDKDARGNTYKIRHYIPDAENTETGDISLVATGTVSYPWTLTAYRDEDGVAAHVFNSMNDSDNGGGDNGGGDSPYTALAQEIGKRAIEVAHENVPEAYYTNVGDEVEARYYRAGTDDWVNFYAPSDPNEPLHSCPLSDLMTGSTEPTEEWDKVESFTASLHNYDSMEPGLDEAAVSAVIDGDTVSAYYRVA